MGGLRPGRQATLGLLRATDPILFGDRLVGRIEPRIEHSTGALRILDLWWQDGFDPLAAPGFIYGFSDAIAAHQAFGGSDRVLWPRAARHRPFVAAVRAPLPSRVRA
ncbi:MAG: hypothetical protein ABJC39_10190 [Chloroflexota bacterium]